MSEPARGPAPSLLLPAVGTVLFVAAVGLPLVALMPWLLTGWRLDAPLIGGEASRWLGALLVLAGLPIWGAAALRFVLQGRGTPAPIAPPSRLVVTGPYRYVRNPMYVAVVSILLGQALLLGSATIAAVALCLLVLFHLFVLLYEEPVLRRRFGDDYATYCRHVHRWLPRPTPYTPSP
jgi:protein-S-isoprenylcysteine O-methyltransferase Ste14